MNLKRSSVLSIASLLALFAAVPSMACAQSPDVTAVQKPSFSQGEAQTDITKLYQWTGDNPRTANVGTIKSADGKEWTVPAKAHFQSATKAADLYNEANGVTPDGIGNVDLDGVPVIDAGGNEVFTAYVFGDNYFEFYVNGKLLAVDPVPMTPFNSNVIRFKSKRLFTIGIMGVDWEERLGLGFEQFRGAPFHQGDGGLVAVIKNADGETVAITDASWKAQTFYTAPLKTKDCLVLKGAIRDSSKCSTEDTADGTGYFAAHWPIPQNWAASDFDDRDWPNAVTFTNDFVGVKNKPAYTNFTDLFDNPQADAQFIWSSSLVHDNLVLMRTTVGKQKDVPSSVMIRLTDPLDESEFYCLDVPGWGPNVQLDKPLTAHTLKKFGSADEMWVLNYPAEGQIYSPTYKRCIEAEHAKAGASLYLKEPGDSPQQRFTLTENGTIVLAEHTDLGFAVAPGKGEPTGGPSHLVRKMGLVNLADTPEKLTKWKQIKDADRWPE